MMFCTEMESDVRTQRFALKIGMMGDSGVGKRTLARIISRMGAVEERYLEILGIAIAAYDFTHSSEGIEIMAKIVLWDITGKRQFRHLHEKYSKGARAGIVVSDASRIGTVLNMPQWADRFREVAGPVPMVWVVNKADLVNKIQLIQTKQRAQDLALSYRAPVLTTTAKDDYTAAQPFLKIAKDLCQMIEDGFLASRGEAVGQEGNN